MRFFAAALFLNISLLLYGMAFASTGDTTRFSAADLLTMCSSAHDTDYGFCAGYVSAVADAMLDESVAEKRACHHDNIRSQQYVDLFRSYAEVFPETMNGGAEETVAAALARAFPCTQ